MEKIIIKVNNEPVYVKDIYSKVIKEFDIVTPFSIIKSSPMHTKYNGKDYTFFKFDFPFGLRHVYIRELFNAADEDIQLAKSGYYYLKKYVTIVKKDTYTYTFKVYEPEDITITIDKKR